MGHACAALIILEVMMGRDVIYEHIVWAGKTYLFRTNFWFVYPR
jgi:hypothetical protein